MSRSLFLAVSRIGEVSKGFKIVGVSTMRSKGGNALFVVRSIETGYEDTVEYRNFKTGIKDYGKPTVLNVGYSYRGATKSPLYKTWSHMLERCYNPKFKAYPNYGGRGVKVCEEWLSFSNFEVQAKRMKNYDKFIKNPHLYSLDKDIIGNGKLYSFETCVFANAIDQGKARKNVKPIIAIDAKGNETEFENVSECCKALGVQNANVYKVLRGEREATKGYTFKRKTNL